MPHANLFAVISERVCHQHITDYLGFRDLRRLSQVCRKIRANPCLDIKFIVRKALTSGNSDAKNTIENLHGCLLSRSIYPPGVQRLLALLITRTCEFCEVRRVRYCGGFGLAICSPCRYAMTAEIETKPLRELAAPVEVNDLIGDPRIATLHKKLNEEYTGSHNSSKLVHVAIFRHAVFEKQGNERIGPAITKDDFDAILKNSQCYDDADRAITNCQPKLSQDIRDFLYTAEAGRAVSVQSMRKLRDKRRKKTIENREKKVKLIQATFAALLQFIPDDLHPVLGNYELDERYPYRKPSHQSYRGRFYIIFLDNPFLNRVMKEFISFPSRYRSTARRKQLARVICRHYGKDLVLPERIRSVAYYRASLRAVKPRGVDTVIGYG